jgi:UDP-glucose:(heptosyl)LPS alpha-1,3-glucosyltransferase
MKIGLVHKRLDLKGGTERDLYRTAEGLRDLGHEIHLFCSEFGVAPPAGTFLHHVPALALGRTARLWSAALWGPRHIRKQRCDIVMGFGRQTEQDVLRSGGGTHRGFLERLGEIEGRRRRLWQTVSPYHRGVLALEKRQFALGNFRRIIAVSNQVKRDIMAHYGVPEARIAVLHNGVDQERFHPCVREKWRREIRAQWRIPDDAPAVLFVGSGFLRKGVDRLLAIWNRPSLRNAYLLIVGEDASLGHYRALAKSAAADRIVFAGRQEAVEKYYGAADVLALPSLQEAFGNVVLEGLACGLPVIVARAAGAAEVLRGEAACGVVDDPNAPDELAEKITAQLERAAEPRYRTELRRTVANYSWRSHFVKLNDELWEVWSEKQRERAC